MDVVNTKSTAVQLSLFKMHFIICICLLELKTFLFRGIKPVFELLQAQAPCQNAVVRAFVRSYVRVVSAAEG